MYIEIKIENDKIDNSLKNVLKTKNTIFSSLRVKNP